MTKGVESPWRLNVKRCILTLTSFHTSGTKNFEVAATKFFFF